MIRRAAIVACSLAAVSSASLAVLGPPHPIYYQKKLSNNSVIYACFSDGLLRIGEFSCTTAMVVVGPDKEQWSSTSVRPIRFDLGKGTQPFHLNLAPPPLLREGGMWSHAFYWRKPFPMGGSVLYQTQVRIPFSTAAFLFATWPALAFYRGPLRLWRRNRKGLCARCGYNLTGNTSGVCPECGTAA
jgi:hypothetical protein